MDQQYPFSRPDNGPYAQPASDGVGDGPTVPPQYSGAHEQGLGPEQDMISAMANYCAEFRLGEDDVAGHRARVEAIWPGRGETFDLYYMISKNREDSPEMRAKRQLEAQKNEERIKDQARDAIRREKQERRLAGELSGPAEAFLKDFEGDDGLMDIDQIMDVPAPEPLVDGLLFKDSLAWIGGQSNTFKSFVALDLVCRYAAGVGQYHREDMPMEQGKALVIVAEGASAYGARVKAWEKTNGRIPRENVRFYPRAIQLADIEVAMPALLAHCKDKQYGLIVFDTQAMCTVGQNENDNTDMGVVMNVLHQLREATGACVLLIHHFGASDEKGMRGATAVYAAATTVIAVKRRSKTDYGITLSTKAPLGKQKDAPAMESFALDLQPVGWDGGGSLVVQRAEYEAPEEKPLPTVNTRQLVILKFLESVKETGGASAAAVAKHVTEEQGTNPRTNKAWSSGTAQSWLATLVRKELVAKGSTYAITELGTEAIADGVTDDDEDA